MWRHMESRRILVMKKLDESKIKWIILQKQKGETTSSTTKTMNISTRWVKKLWARYRYAGSGQDHLSYPHVKAGEQPSRMQGTFCSTGRQDIESSWGHAPAQNHQGQYRNRYPCNKIHQILRDANFVSEHPKKSRRRKWIRFERYLFELHVAHRLQAARWQQMVPVL